MERGHSISGTDIAVRRICHLVRLLSPKDYGLVGMVLVFTGFAMSLADMGLGASIIQKTELSDRHLNSVFYGRTFSPSMDSSKRHPRER